MSRSEGRRRVAVTGPKDGRASAPAGTIGWVSLAMIILAMCSAPFVIYGLRKPHWNRTPENRVTAQETSP